MLHKALIWLVFAALPFQGWSQLAVQPIGGEVNTSGDETAPFRYGERLYFTSSDRHPFQPESVKRIFSSNGEAASQYNINPSSAEAHAADLTLSSDAKRMYYTICKSGDCNIWMRERNYEGDWAAAQKLPYPINQRGVSCQQPTVGYDRILGKDVLYFSAEKPSGNGGKDIWGSVIEKDFETGEIKYQMPFHLPFNTCFDEVTPFFHMASQTLFFSSNGLPGMGGFDIFSVKKNEEGDWEEVENAGVVLNSPKDELHYCFHSSSTIGYFSSNRSGDNFDIYEASPVNLYRLAVYDIQSARQIFDVEAEVFDVEKGRSFVLRQQPFDGAFNLELEPDKEYRVAVLAQGYAPKLLVLETENQYMPYVADEVLYLFREDPSLSGNREEAGKVFGSNRPVNVKPTVPVRSGNMR